MFTEISTQVKTYLEALPAFTSVMTHDEVLHLFPIVASEGRKLPLATYIMGEEIPETKDKTMLPVTLALWFDKEKYNECCVLTDAVKAAIQNDLDFISASIEFNEESFTYSGIINFYIT